MRSPEIQFALSPEVPSMTRAVFIPQKTELSSNLSKETVIETGAKVVGVTLIGVGFYKLITANSITDLVVGGVLIYAGYKLLTGKSKKAS